EGKRRMERVGKVDITPEAFLAVLKVGSGNTSTPPKGRRFAFRFIAPCYNEKAMRSQLRRYLSSLVFAFLLCMSIAVGSTAGVLFVYNSDLPQVSSLEDYHPSLITEVYSDDGRVIGSFALERRIVITWDQIPQVVKDAITSVEVQNVYAHRGIDFFGMARAGLKNLMAGRVVEG